MHPLLKAYERQALKHSVRIVRSNPHTVKSPFQTHAMQQSRQTARSVCRWQDFSAQAGEFGNVLHMDGHAAQLLTIRAAGGGEKSGPQC